MMRPMWRARAAATTGRMASHRLELLRARRTHRRRPWFRLLSQGRRQGWRALGRPPLASAAARRLARRLRFRCRALAGARALLAGGGRLCRFAEAALQGVHKVDDVARARRHLRHHRLLALHLLLDEVLERRLIVILGEGFGIELAFLLLDDAFGELHHLLV